MSNKGVRSFFETNSLCPQVYVPDNQYKGQQDISCYIPMGSNSKCRITHDSKQNNTKT